MLPALARLAGAAVVSATCYFRTDIALRRAAGGGCTILRPPIPALVSETNARQDKRVAEVVREPGSLRERLRRIMTIWAEPDLADPALAAEMQAYSWVWPRKTEADNQLQLEQGFKQLHVEGLLAHTILLDPDLGYGRCRSLPHRDRPHYRALRRRPTPGRAGGRSGPVRGSAPRWRRARRGRPAAWSWSRRRADRP